MEISGIAQLATQMTQQRTTDEAALLVLKKAMDTQKSSAQTLIDAITPASALPAHLGQNVNTVA